MIFFIQCKERGKIKNKKPTCRERERLKGFVCKSEKPRSEEEDDDDEIVRRKFHIFIRWPFNRNWELGGPNCRSNPLVCYFRVMFSSLGRI